MKLNFNQVPGPVSDSKNDQDKLKNNLNCKLIFKQFTDIPEGPNQTYLFNTLISQWIFCSCTKDQFHDFNRSFKTQKNDITFIKDFFNY